MEQKEQHEDRALTALMTALTAQGHRVAIVAHPDRELTHTLTVDALVDVDGTVWAVDHAVVSREANLVPAMDAGRKALQGPLENIARQHGCALHVSFKPQERAVEKAYYETVLHAARRAAADKQHVFEDDGFTSVQIAQHLPPGEVSLTPFLTLSGSALVGVQVEVGLRDAVERKLSKQLKKAKAAGYPVMLLLDKNPRPEGRNGTVWMAHSATIAAALQPLLDKHPGIVDLVWVVGAFGGVAELAIGNLPSATPEKH